MLTKITKTSVKIVAENQADFEALVIKLQSILDLNEPEKLAVLEENLTAIVNTDIQAEINALNNLSESMIQAEIAEQNKTNYLNSTQQKGQMAFLKWRSIAFDFLYAKQQALASDPTSTLYSDISNESLLTAYQQYLFYFYVGMIPELITAIQALPANSLMLKEFYPIGQTTTTVKDEFISYLQGL